MSIKLLLTGGHAATPALGIVEEIAKRETNWKLYWVGPVSAMESGQVTTAAEKILSDYGVRIHKIVAGRALRRGDLITKLRAYIKIPFGFINAMHEVIKINPDLVISFGGFVSLPVVFAAWILRKKIIIQEQIVGAGLSNKLSSYFAYKIFVARKESLEFFPKDKTYLIGNPQVSNFFKIKEKQKIGNPPTIFITGGSSGAQIINQTIDKILDQLLLKYKVIHQTGENNLEYFEKKLKSNYKVVGYVKPMEFAKFFEEADIVISRAGANTVADIIQSKRPAILIPIPWSIGDEQTKNAQKAVEAGIGKILKQDELNPENLLNEIAKVRENWDEMVKNVKLGDYALDGTAASKIVDEIEVILAS